MEDDAETETTVASILRDPVIWSEEMTQPKPFLMPSEDGDPIEALPPEKENRKVKWAQSVELLEIENRWQQGLVPDDDDDDSYDIEIVEDDGDADFYLEIVDGEIFYVFETEDDMSVDDDDYDEDDEDDGDADENSTMDDGGNSDNSSSDDNSKNVPTQPLQLDIPGMMTPAQPLQLDISGMMGPPVTDESITNVVTMSIPQEINVIEPEEAEDMDLEDKQVQQRPYEEFTADDRSPESKPVTFPPVENEETKATSQQASYLTPPSSPVKEDGDNSSKIASTSPPTSPSRSPVRSILKASPHSSPIKSPIKKPKSANKKTKTSEKVKTVTKRYVRADTFDGEHQVFTWEKPKWTDAKLKETGKGQDVRKGANLADPITFPKKKQQSNQEPEMYEDDQGNFINKEELVRRIQEGDDAAVAFVPRPTYGGRYQRKLRCSALGAQMRNGQDLAKPITRATVDRERDDINHLANKDVLKNRVKTVRRTYSWDKPDWALKANLKHTDKGSAVKKGESVSAPITHIREVKKKGIEWEKPEWVKSKLKGTSKGSTVKEGGSLQKPITHIADHVNSQKESSEQ